MFYYTVPNKIQLTCVQGYSVLCLTKFDPYTPVQQTVTKLKQQSKLRLQKFKPFVKGHTTNKRRAEINEKHLMPNPKFQANNKTYSELFPVELASIGKTVFLGGQKKSFLED